MMGLWGWSCQSLAVKYVDLLLVLSSESELLSHEVGDD